MKAHNLQVTGSLVAGGEAIGSISSSVAITTLGLGSRITTIEGKSLVSGSGQIPSLLPSGVVSGSAQTIANLPSGVVSGSAQTLANLPSGTVSGSVQVDVMSTTNIARLATTGSNTFQGSQTVNGSLVVTGSLTAQQFIVSSSVTYLTESFASGSHKFGDSSDDYHDFTGSLRVTGSVTINKQNEGLILSSGVNTDASYLSTRANNSTGWLIIGSQGTTANYIQTGAAANESAITTVGAYALSIGTNQTERIKVTSAGQTQFSTNTNGGNIRLSSNGTAMEMYNTSGTVRNWQLSSQVVNSMCMDFTPSTANGGTTYTTPILTLDGEQNRVGIGTGTSRPGSILHIKGGTAGGADFGAELRVWENTFGAVLQGFTYGTTAAFLGNFRYNINTPASSTSNYYNAGHGMLFLDGVHIFASQPGGTSGGAFTPSERLTILNSGNVGVSVTSPASKLHVGGNIKYIGRIFSGNAIVGNIYTNLTGAAAPSYILLYDLNDTAGWSLVGHCNAASYTCWNISQIYVQKNYSSTAASAGITGLYKSGCNMTIVDLSYGGGRYIAIGYTSNPEIDVVWTGYNLTNQFTSDGQATVVAGASVTVNSTLATY